ncbi:hypothetical protein PR202_gb27186 [Eleusine coracana subsp. coracana]|uniref:Smr domain-containing protein n=1 Tax=Eleusine coracana subsp. coracana TaxID=191504 RepID=A0AAV5FUP0_ELECO|nr:hypothetical protein PR202_gb27186 [Eleusine coracana subsp. coracana]
MKPSKKKSKKKKKPAASPEPATPAPPAAASTAEPCSPSETLTLAAAAAASETESSSSSSCEASSTSAFTASSSGTASTFSAFSSSASTVSSSATGDERRDLAWLLDAFSTATIDQVDTAYCEAGGDAFLAAGILGSTLDAQPRPRPPPPPDPAPRDGSGGKKACRKPKKLACAASGMVADVIGKEYIRPAPSPMSVTNAWKGRDGLGATNEWKGGGGEGDGARKYSVEEAEQFLCAMLGDNSELGMGVVRDVLGMSGYDVEKALDALLDLSGVSSSRDNEMHNANGSNAERSGTHCPNIFLGNGLSMGNITADDKQSLFQLAGQISSMTLQSEVEHDFLWGEPQTSYAQAVKAMPCSPTLSSRPTVSKANPQQGMAIAALAYSKGDKSYASYLAEEGKHYRELARLEDEKASREIFEARNKHITNTVTIDLHGQHVKQAMKLLKVHMMICICMPSVILRVITGCGSEGTGKGKIKRSVIELVEKERIEWHEENSGTIVLRLGGPREYGFLEHDSDTD